MISFAEQRGGEAAGREVSNHKVQCSRDPFDIFDVGNGWGYYTMKPNCFAIHRINNQNTVQLFTIHKLCGILLSVTCEGPKCGHSSLVE